MFEGAAPILAADVGTFFPPQALNENRAVKIADLPLVFLKKITPTTRMQRSLRPATHVQSLSFHGAGIQPHPFFAIFTCAGPQGHISRTEHAIRYESTAGAGVQVRDRDQPERLPDRQSRHGQDDFSQPPQSGGQQKRDCRGAHGRRRHQCRRHDHPLVFPAALQPLRARQPAAGGQRAAQISA